MGGGVHFGNTDVMSSSIEVYPPTEILFCTTRFLVGTTFTWATITGVAK